MLAKFYQENIHTIESWNQSNQKLEKFISNNSANQEEQQFISQLKRTLKRISNYLKLETFKSHIEKLEEQVRQEKNKKDKELRQKSRILREKLQDYLFECQSNGKIYSMTTWSQFLSEQLLPTDLKEGFLSVEDYKGTSPRDLFYDFVEEKLEIEYREQKEIILKQLKELKISVEHDSDLNSILHTLIQSKDQLKERYTIHILEEMKSEALSLHNERLEKIEKALKRIEEYFQYDYFDLVSPQTTWEQAQKWISNRNSYFDLLSFHSEHLAQERWAQFFKKFMNGEFKRNEESSKKNHSPSHNSSPHRNEKRKNIEREDPKSSKKQRESREKIEEEEGEISDF